MANHEKILQLLKTQGQQTSQQLADTLQLTMMGARKHLLNLAEQGLVTAHTGPTSAGRGRPQQFWQLSKTGHQYFPDRHADVSLQLIAGVRQLFGATGLEQLIVQREQQQLQDYQTRLKSVTELADIVLQLARIRSEEGYLAEAFLQGNDWYLVEHHCPICAAAQGCQSFCRSELNIFQQCVAQLASVERTEHLFSSGKRCVYRFIPNQLEDAFFAGDKSA